MNILKSAPLAAFACGLILTAGAAAQKKKKEVTQTLQLPKELPTTAIGETRRLTFHVTPLSAKGLLSAQVREALKALNRETNGPVIHIRAFVAGSGDLRRVRDLVSETFTDHKQPLPSLSLVQAGGLPLEGAQVVLEAIAVGKKEVNPQGLVFIPATVAANPNPLAPVAPLAGQSLAALQANLQASGSEAADVLRVTCFLSSLDNIDDTRSQVAAAYPRAALDFVQNQRAPGRAVAACEAVARAAAGASKGAVTNAPMLLFSGSQVSFGYQESDSRLAFERLRKSIETAGVGRSDIVFAHYYPLAESMAAQVRKLAPDFFGAPASTLLLFEGLPSMQAGFAVDVIAAKP